MKVSTAQEELIRYAGIAMLSVWGGRKILVALGILTDAQEAAATAVVNADYQNNIAWKGSNWTDLEKTNFTPGVYSPERFTYTIIFHSVQPNMSPTYPDGRVGVYRYIFNWLQSTLAAPTTQDVQNIVNYINDHIYCQMEIAAVIRDIEISYPYWQLAYFVNQTWWAKWLDPSNTLLLPLFQCVHNLPNYITPQSASTDINGLAKEIQAILSTQNKLANY